MPAFILMGAKKRFWNFTNPAMQSEATAPPIQAQHSELIDKPFEFGELIAQPDETLVEIRDLLKRQCEFNDWLKGRLVATGTFGST